MTAKQHKPIDWTKIAGDTAVISALHSRQANNGRKHNKNELREDAKKTALFRKQ